jgi:hypothetical protein
MSDFSFTKEGVERPQDNDFAPIPAGTYRAMIEKTEWTKDKNDQNGPDHLKLTITILDGEFKNRKIWKKLKLKSSDESDRKRANGVLAQLLDAINLNGIRNTSELCSKPFDAKISIFAPQDGKPMNVLNTFLPPAQIGEAVGLPTSEKKPWG